MGKPDLKGMPLSAVVQAFMDQKGWEDEIEITEDRTHSTVETTIGINDQAHNLFIEVEEPAQRVHVYLYSPYKLPPRRVDAMVKILNRINNQLQLGRLTCNDGDDASPIQFMCGIDVEGGTLAAAQVDMMYGYGANAFQTWGELLAAVALTKRPAEELWSECLAEQEAAASAEEEEGPSEL